MVIHALDFTVPVEDHAALLYIYIHILQRFLLGCNPWCFFEKYIYKSTGTLVFTPSHNMKCLHISPQRTDPIRNYELWFCLGGI